MSALTVIEEYAIWLAETGVTDSAQDDLNEGGDPVTERGDTVSDEEWRAAMALAHEIADWIRDHPETLLALVRDRARAAQLLAAAADLEGNSD